MTMPAVMKIDILGMDMLLRGRVLHEDRRLRLAERAADESANAAKIDAEGALAILLTGQDISDHWHVVAFDRGEQQGRSAIALLHDRGDLKLRIGRCGVSLQAAIFRHAAQRGAKAGIQN